MQRISWSISDNLVYEETVKAKHCCQRMGFPGVPPACTGLLPCVFLQAAISVTALVDTLQHVWQTVGLRRVAAVHNGDSILVQDNASAFSGLQSRLALTNLFEEIRLSLPISLYDCRLNGGSSSEDNQCAVCLSNFVLEEEVRLLPYCTHIFHKACLDRWLDHEHTTCPLCRSSLIPEDLAGRHRRREEELTEDLIRWFSSFHGGGFHSSLHGAGFLWWHN